MKPTPGRNNPTRLLPWVDFKEILGAGLYSYEEGVRHPGWEREWSNPLGRRRRTASRASPTGRGGPSPSRPSGSFWKAFPLCSLGQGVCAPRPPSPGSPLPKRRRAWPLEALEEVEAHPEVPYLDLDGEEEATEIVFIGQGILRRQELERALAVCLG